MLVSARNDLPMNDPCLERVLRSRFSLWHARAFPQTVVVCEFRGHVCPQQLQQSKLAKRGMKFIEEKRFIYSSISGV